MIAAELVGDASGSTSFAAQEAKSAKLLLSRLGLLLEPVGPVGPALISESVESPPSTMEGGRDDGGTGACGREEKPEKPCAGGAMRWSMVVAVLK
jgi:hypothetical protein